MKSLKQTIWILISRSGFTLSLILLTTIGAQSLIQLAVHQGTDSEEFFRYIMGIDAVLSALFGFYIGETLSRLRNSFVWKVNHRYRHILIASHLTTLTLYALLLAPMIVINLDNEFFLVLLPLCVSIFSSAFLLKRTLANKYWFLPLVIGVTLLGLDNLFTISVLTLGTAAVVYELVKNESFSPNHIANVLSSSKQDLIEEKSFSKLLPSHLISHYVERIASNQLTKNTRNIDWAVSTLSSKFYLMIIMWAIIIILLQFAIKESENTIVFIFTLMVISNFSTESQQLLWQTSPFAHTFSPNNYRRLKIEIIRSVDKIFLTNALLFLSLAYFGSWMISSKFNQITHFLMSGFFILVGLSFNPLFLNVNPKNEQWFWFGAFSTFVAFIYFSMTYFVPYFGTANGLELFSSVGSYIFIAFCIIIRYLGVRVFYRCSIEKLIAG